MRKIIERVLDNQDSCCPLFLCHIRGKSVVTPEMAVRFEKAFGGTADTWLRMQLNYDLALVRQRAGKISVKRLAPRHLVHGVV
jgi:plasmid maintenance system antidote protein VapI